MNATCSCGQRYAVVPSNLKAHPGYRTEPQSVTVPTEDIQGNRTGTTQRTLTSRWISEGPSLSLSRTETQTEVTYSWACPCGATPSVATPRRHQVPCGACGGPRSTAPSPSALFRNSGGACPCCGHAGYHWVPWGETTPCGNTPT